MFELVEIDPKTGDEELLCEGSWAQMIEARDEASTQAEDDGYDIPHLRIQPQ